jgi:hypothetical protein
MPITIGVGRHVDCAERQLTFTTGLNTDQPNILVGDKVIERPDGVAAATDTGHNDIWQFPSHFQQLFLNLFANDTLEVSDNSREWMRANSRAY